jgi:O-methyltransferase
MKYFDFLEQYPLISEQVTRRTLAPVLAELEAILQQGIVGDVVEFGCYAGTSSLFIRRLLDAYDQSPERTFYAYDSFAGLPEKGKAEHSSIGLQFKAGELAVSKKELMRNFHKAKLTPPVTYKAWFQELTARQLPERVAFAFLDGDFYQSIFDSLSLVWPRLARGGTITVDDYQREALPGVTEAVADFFQAKRHELRFVYHTGIIKKL